MMPGSLGGVAQPGRALRSQRRGHGFKSRHLHSLTAGFGFIAVIVAMFVLPRRLRQDDNWSDLVGWSPWMGIAATILMLLFLFASETDGFLDGQVGLVQRIFAATVLTWLFVLALRLFQVSNPQARAKTAA